MYSERDLIRRIQRRFGNARAGVGIGDDAAVLEEPSGFSTLVCSDLLVENTHFRRSTHPPESIGYKAVAINVSDIGAMGGVPAFCLMSLAVPSGLEESWIDGLLDGLERACREFSVGLVGGDTSLGERVFVDVSMVGRVPTGAAVERRGARVGDSIYVTGALGASALGLRMLDTAGPEDPAVRRHLYPEPRHEIGRELGRRATAMTDVSDGLSIDLGHILEASGVSARVEERLIPCAGGASIEMALHGGEDYELIVTGRDLPPRIGDVPITRIGEIVSSGSRHECHLATRSGMRPLGDEGWQHFR